MSGPHQIGHSLRVDAERPDTETEPERDVPAKEYVGYIWINDEPGQRLSVWARSSGEARRKVEEEYGEGHVCSIWNEEDSNRPR